MLQRVVAKDLTGELWEHNRRGIRMLSWTWVGSRAPVGVPQMWRVLITRTRNNSSNTLT